LLQITTPSHTFFDDMVESVTVTTMQGELGVLYGLAPIVSIIKSGPLTIKSNNKYMKAITGDGFIKVRNNKVEILCNKCLWEHEIEEEAAPYDHDKELQKRKQSIEEHNKTKTNLMKGLTNK